MIGCENRRSNHQCVGAGLGHALNIARFDATIDLEKTGWVAPVELGPQAANPIERRWNEGLTAKPWINAHEQHLSQHRDHFIDRIQWRRWVQGDARQSPRLLDCAQSAVEMGVRFDVDGHDIGAGGDEALDPAIGIDDHQVNVDRQSGGATDRFDQWQADRDIGYEDPVHNVDVNEIRTGGFGGVELLAEPEKIGGENRRSDPDGARLHRFSFARSLQRSYQRRSADR